jgi:hypothetical protein
MHHEIKIFNRVLVKHTAHWETIEKKGGVILPGTWHPHCNWYKGLSRYDFFAGDFSFFCGIGFELWASCCVALWLEQLHQTLLVTSWLLPWQLLDRSVQQDSLGCHTGSQNPGTDFTFQLPTNIKKGAKIRTNRHQRTGSQVYVLCRQCNRALMIQMTWVKYYWALSHLIFSATLWGGYYFPSCFTSRELAVQRDGGPKAHRYYMAEPGLQVGLQGSWPPSKAY